MSIELKITDRTDVTFPIIIKDKKGNKIYEQNENGDWCEWTYDNNNNRLTGKTSCGYWCKRTYDNNKNELTYKNSSGYHEIKGKKVTKEEYEAFLLKMPLKIDWSLLKNYEKVDSTTGSQQLACGGNSCELVDLTN